MKVFYSLGLSLALLLTGCASQSGGISANSYGDVRVDNSTVAREVSVTDINSRPAGDLLKATALLTNLSAKDLNVQYKFTWYDADDMTIEDESTSWKVLQLHGKQPLQVSAVSPNNQAMRFDVYVRKAVSSSRWCIWCED